MTVARPRYRWACLGLLAFLLGGGLAHAETGPRLGVVSTLSGEVTVTRAGSQAPVPLKFKDDVVTGDTIVTAKGAVARLLLGSVLATVREQSSVVAREERGAIALDLRKGMLGLNVSGQQRAGPPVQLTTPSTRALVGRGTVMVRIAPTPPGQTSVFVLAGSAEVFARSAASRPALVVEAPRALTVTGRTVGRTRDLSPEESARLQALLRPGSPQHATAPDAVVKETVRRGKATAAKELAKHPELGRPGVSGGTERIGGALPGSAGRSSGTADAPQVPGAGPGGGGGERAVPPVHSPPLVTTPSPGTSGGSSGGGGTGGSSGGPPGLKITVDLNKVAPGVSPTGKDADAAASVRRDQVLPPAAKQRLPQQQLQQQQLQKQLGR
jgi:hypothetical protein